MKRPSRSIASLAARLGVAALAQIALIMLMVALVPGIRIDTMNAAAVGRALIAAVIIGAVNLSIGPLLLALRLPLNPLTAGVPLLLINFGLLLLTVAFVPGLDIARAGDVWAGAAILAVGNTVLTAFVALDDDYSYLQYALGTTRSFGRKTQRMIGVAPQRGMVLLEIDGLSYERMQTAADKNLMPTVRDLIGKGSHCLSLFECGLPSQTSACQAGILFGSNAEIPAFRWYDKSQRRMLVSNHLADATEINDFHSTGLGLLRGGSSINNLINGDAARTLLTLSTLSGASASKVPSERAVDLFNSFWLNPYTFARTIALSVIDVLREVVQAITQILKNEQPRINRLVGGYPFLRVITNVFLRDLATYAVMQEIVRGTPIIYTTFVGYDEVAHHAGPDTSDALNTLRGYDRQVRHVLQTIERLAPMDYDLFLLSDHGQTAGATFRQRYGKTLRQLIDELTHDQVSVAEMKTQEAGRSYVKALLTELSMANTQLQAQRNTRIRRAAMQGAMKTLGGIDKPAPVDSMDASAIVVCASGCLALVYFNSISQNKASLAQIETAHPHLIEAMVRHAGIGFVVGYDGDGNVIVLGKGGARNLSTGSVTDNDPLAPFGNVELRAEQILRLAEFNNAGDLIVNSMLFADGSVAAFEELIGSHGGLGGQQTHAFILHPCAGHIDTAHISNSADVYALLEAWKNGGNKN